MTGIPVKSVDQLLEFAKSIPVCNSQIKPIPSHY